MSLGGLDMPVSKAEASSGLRGGSHRALLQGTQPPGGGFRAAKYFTYVFFALGVVVVGFFVSVCVLHCHRRRIRRRAHQQQQAARQQPYSLPAPLVCGRENLNAVRSCRTVTSASGTSICTPCVSRLLRPENCLAEVHHRLCTVSNQLLCADGNPSERGWEVPCRCGAGTLEGVQRRADPASRRASDFTSDPANCTHACNNISCHVFRAAGMLTEPCKRRSSAARVTHDVVHRAGRMMLGTLLTSRYHRGQSRSLHWTRQRRVCAGDYALRSGKPGSAGP